MARHQAINTDLQTDQHFADAEEMVKFCDKAEKNIDLVKANALVTDGQASTSCFKSLGHAFSEAATQNLPNARQAGEGS